MPLSTKTAVAVFLGVGLLTFGLGLAAESVVLRSFAELEAEQAKRHAISTKQNLLGMVDELEHASQDSHGGGWSSASLHVTLASGPLDAEEAEIWAALERGDEVVLRRPSDTELASYVALENIRGERIGFLGVREESTMVVAATGVVRAVRLGLLGTGALFSLVSVLLLRLGIVSRLRSLIGAIMSFGRGELSSHDAGGADEIGGLAEAFVDMRGKILDRERGVSKNAAEVRLVLDHTGNGVVSATRSGRIVGEVSRAAREWLGEPGDRAITDYLFEDDARRRAAVALGFEQLTARSLPDDLIVDQLPRLVERNGLRLEVPYLTVEDEGEEDIVLIMLRNVTEAHQLSK
ncbi:MAG: HAMP domain-containing protein, partial [Polyangiaceae bacterium]|nr:HAMP domain-containing protein [Polyangiaceae bacterium]